MPFFILFRAVALYFIDKLALRAGNEKDADESADTVGCCSLRVEHMSMLGMVCINRKIGIDVLLLEKDGITSCKHSLTGHLKVKIIKCQVKVEKIS